MDINIYTWALTSHYRLIFSVCLHVDHYLVDSENLHIEDVELNMNIATQGYYLYNGPGESGGVIRPPQVKRWVTAHSSHGQPLRELQPGQ